MPGIYLKQNAYQNNTLLSFRLYIKLIRQTWHSSNNDYHHRLNHTYNTEMNEQCVVLLSTSIVTSCCVEPQKPHLTLEFIITAFHIKLSCHTCIYNNIHNVWVYAIKPCKAKNKDNVILARHFTESIERTCHDT